MDQPVLKIRQVPLSGSEIDAMASVAARAFVDDPLAVAVFARAREAREVRIRSVYEGLLRAQAHPPITAWQAGEAVGLVGLTPSRTRLLSVGGLLAGLPRLGRGTRLREVRPALAWLRAVAGAAGDRDDWHLGPVAVDPDLHGEGVGRCMLTRACQGLDSTGDSVAVSTDVEANVDFYIRFGFEHVDTTEVLGTPIWHMWRPAAARTVRSIDRKE